MFGHEVLVGQWCLGGWVGFVDLPAVGEVAAVWSAASGDLEDAGVFE
jgi:hypothetical protein